VEEVPQPVATTIGAAANPDWVPPPAPPRVARHVPEPTLPVRERSEEVQRHERRTLTAKIVVTVALVGFGVMLVKTDLLGWSGMRALYWVIYSPIATVILIGMWRRGWL
jgi:hypothetical protein